MLGGGDSSQVPANPLRSPAPPPKASEEKQTPTAEAAEELGYPSFATNNTTRVGGSDPASTAAGVALAVFPSATRGAATGGGDPRRRSRLAGRGRRLGPDGGAGAGTDCWSPPAATCPTRPRRPSKRSTRRAAKTPAGRQAFAIGDAPTPEGLKATQVKGREPAALAAAIATLRDKLLGGPPQHIVLAPEDEPGFAMPAAAWAARSGDPVLFSDAKKLPAATVEALKRHPKVPVYLLGPSSAISSDVVREVAKVDKRVRRVSGEDPVENAIALARYADGGFGWNVNDPGHGFVVARSDSPLDAASRRRSRPPVPGDRCCSPTTPIRCRRRCANTCSTSSRATPPIRRAPSTTTFG